MEHRITGFDNYLFKLGRHYEIYEKLGAHPVSEDGEQGTYFAVWAPNAVSVSVVGDFNGWNPEKHPMTLAEESDIYELFVPGVNRGELYKYAIRTQKGDVLYKADPYGNLCQVRPENASIVIDIQDYRWSDQAWEEKKKSPMKQISRWLSMKCISAHGKRALTGQITDFWDTGSLPMNWLNT